MSKRQKFLDQFKGRVAVRANCARGGDRTIQEIAAKHRLHPPQVSTWKKQENTYKSAFYARKIQLSGNSDYSSSEKP